MSLSLALEQLQAEVDSFLQGTKQQPREGTADWFLLRAKSIGLSYLRSIEKQKLDQPASARAADRVYKVSRGQLQDPIPSDAE